MDVSRRFSVRLLFAFAAAALVVGIGAAAAFGQGSGGSAGDNVSGGSTGVGAGNGPVVSPPGVAAGSGIVAPAWCCGTNGSVPGLTAVGQATIEGPGQAARDAAIAAAVKDATAQATAAADAARIPLGAIVDLQVSAMPTIYPMMGTAGGVGTEPGSTGGAGGAEPAPAPGVYVGSVSVTITWSLG